MIRFAGLRGVGGVFSIRPQDVVFVLLIGVFAMQKVTLLEQLPVELNRGVGRIVSAHALLEHHLSACIASLVGLGHKERRLVLAEPRSEDRLQTIKRLIQVHGLSVHVPAQLTPKSLKMIR
ncbi:MAG TPA: hypothetical protein VEU95_13350, partial [Micropepsaceae bacterium]|nr:hypothetical protein [Micropepsaceae bacterium]